MGPLETIQSGLNNWLRDVQTYLAGKGVVSFAVIAASVLSSISFMPWIVPFTVAAGGVGLNMFRRLTDQWHYQDDMAIKYKDEIGAQLGIDPSTVTREHVKTLAYGNEQEGIEGNPILAQALDRQRSKSWLVFGTALLAAGVTFLLLSTGAGIIAGGMLSAMPILEGVPFIPTIVGMMGGAVVAGLSSLFIQDGLELLIGAKSGISAPSAHDRINAIEARHARGKTVTPEQVFQVKLCISPELEERVVAMTGKPFHSLKANVQERVLAQMDLKGEMSLIAREINKGNIDATELAFILTGQQPIHKAEVEKESTEELAQVAERKPSFTERLGLKAHDAAVERVDESRVVPIESGRI